MPEPEPPSEFQRFAASSVGVLLPIYGASLFERVPTTFAPLDRVPVTADYVIGPGDEILLRIWGQVNMDLNLVVDRAGAVYIPQAGSVTVAGIEFRQLPDFLRSQLERVFRNFDLSVNMGQLRSIQVLVMGYARRPGSYTVSSLSTVVNALFAAGGPSAQGSMRRVQLKRGAAVVAEIDLYDLLQRGDKSGDVRLLPGDVVYVPPVGPQVAAAGSVKNPAVYELKGEQTVGDLVAMTGGLSALADRERATLERIVEGARRIVEFRLDEGGMRLPVTDGDVLRMRTIQPRFAETVTLRGNVANPGRFHWRPGMRLKDIIPDRESLVTRDYWKKRNLLGFTPPGEAIAAAPVEELQREFPETRIGPTAPDINWSYAVIERQNPQDLMTKLIPFHLGRLVLDNEAGQNLELRPGDVVTIFSQADIRVPQMQQTRTVRLEGEFNAPGIYNVEPGETLGRLIEKAGGLTPQAYLFGSEFLRESVRRDQRERMERYIQDLEQEVDMAARNRLANADNSGQAQTLEAEIRSQRAMVERLRLVQPTGRIVLSLEPGSNDFSQIAHMTLEDGDRFIVPALPATVNVMGAVYNPNALVFAKKRPVREYIAQAGGFTRNADEDRVYILQADGSVIPRRSTSGFDKKRLNPGDSVIIPEHLFKTTFLTKLRSWSEVIAQFGLGAAAINVLR
jgi:protein involved in polysaccharide export with SLBB domain